MQFAVIAAAILVINPAIFDLAYKQSCCMVWHALRATSCNSFACQVNKAKFLMRSQLTLATPDAKLQTRKSQAECADSV
jgi:hypothetical protein